MTRMDRNAFWRHGVHDQQRAGNASPGTELYLQERVRTHAGHGTVLPDCPGISFSDGQNGNWNGEDSIPGEDNFTGPTRYGEKIMVETPTYISGTMEFQNGVCGNLLTSFDLHYPYWDSKLPFIQIFGSEGTLSAPNADSFDGPVLARRFGGEFTSVPLTHGFIDNSRGIGARGYGRIDCSGKETPREWGHGLSCSRHNDRFLRCRRKRFARCNSQHLRETGAVGPGSAEELHGAELRFPLGRGMTSGLNNLFSWLPGKAASRNVPFRRSAKR